LVEYVASTGVGFSHGWIEHRSCPADAPSDHGAGAYIALPDFTPRRHAQRNIAPSRTQHASSASAEAGGGECMNLGPHADFIIAAYAVTIFVIAALIAWVVLDYSAQQRILGDLEERGITRRSQRKS